MRVAFVTTSYPETPDDPAGHFVRAEARAHVAAGDDVTVIAPAVRTETRRDAGLTVRALAGGGAFGWPGVASRIAASPLSLGAASVWVYNARIALASLEVDRVIAHWVLPSVWPIATARARRAVELVGVSHGADVRLLCAMPRILRARLVATIAARVDRWRFVSESLLRELTDALATREVRMVEARATVLASPFEMPRVDRDVANARRRELRADTVMSVVGRLTEGKRVHRAIDYARSRGERAHIVVVGDGPERERLERYARACGVRATFVGKTTRTEAALWMAASDELVIASNAEGLSTVAREAAELGVPVRFV